MPTVAEKRTKEKTVYNYLVRHINNNGGIFTDWYCGITDDIERRLFDEHNVSKNSKYNYRKCHVSNSARKVEKALLEKGCAGGDGGGSDKSVYVYVYRITPNTRQ